MAMANFQEVCKAMCELAGIEAPVVVPNEQGSEGLAVTFDDVTVQLTHEPNVSGEHVLARVLFGRLPKGRELETCRRLMEANTQLRGAGPSFSRHPATGEIIYQFAYALMDVTAQDLYSWCMRVVETVHEWRREIEGSDASPSDDAASSSAQAL